MAISRVGTDLAGTQALMAYARFTPSLLDEETLESLFVHRWPLLDDAVDRARQSATSSERAHRLFIGPRGAGKTHLISLIYYRIRHLQQSGLQLTVSWLPEDPWAVDSYEDLLEEVIEHIETSSDHETDRPDGSRGDADLEATILKHVGSTGPIVVLVENLDQIFDNIGATGQRRLRAFLENQGPFLLVATATRLTEDLLDQAEAFYGFFDTTTLQPFDASQAAEMLQAIARNEGDSALENRLGDERSHVRLAAIQHLAGGQPRVWALLAAGLRLDGLDELVTTLIERFDDLTPFYQEQLARLSPRERQVVRTLADADRSMTVSEIAASTRADQRSVAKTISGLRHRGWVQARTGPLVELADRRLTFYELAEPLARLAFQIKAARGKPVKLVLDFLVAWFEQEELFGAAPSSPLTSGYLEQAQHIVTEPNSAIIHALSKSSGPTFYDPTALTFHDPTTLIFAPRQQKQEQLSLDALEALDDACAAFEKGDPRPLLKQPSALSHLIEHRLRTTTSTAIRFEIAMIATTIDPLRWTTRAEKLLADVPDDERTSALLLIILTQADQHPTFDLLLETTLTAIEADTNPELPYRVIEVASELIRRNAPSIAATLTSALADSTPPKLRSALAYIESAAASRIGHPSSIPEIWEHTLNRLLQDENPDHLLILKAKSDLASSYRSAGRTNEAITLQEQVLTDSERILGTNHIDTLRARGNLALSYSRAGRTNEAICIEETLLADSERTLGIEHPLTLTTRSNLAGEYLSTGGTDEAITLQEQVLTDSERILGLQHPQTLSARSNLAGTYLSAGRTDEAITLQEQVLTDSERILGSQHPNVLTSKGNLATLYWSAGRAIEAIALQEQVLADRERILGPEHPDTLIAKNNLAHLQAGINWPNAAT